MVTDYEVGQRVHARITANERELWRTGSIIMVIKNPESWADGITQYIVKLDSKLTEAPYSFEVGPDAVMHSDRCALFTAAQLRRMTVAEEFAHATLPWLI